MSIDALPRNGGYSHALADCPPRAVVAVVIEWRGRVALFKRSQSVGHDHGLWHCITGYLEPATSPRQQALVELEEETGLTSEDLDNFQPGEPLLIADQDGNPWLIHTFLAAANRSHLTLNNEHDAFRWTLRSKISRFSNRVPWLDPVLQAVKGDETTEAQ